MQTKGMDLIKWMSFYKHNKVWVNLTRLNGRIKIKCEVDFPPTSMLSKKRQSSYIHKQNFIVYNIFEWEILQSGLSFFWINSSCLSSCILWFIWNIISKAYLVTMASHSLLLSLRLLLLNLLQELKKITENENKSPTILAFLSCGAQYSWRYLKRDGLLLKKSTWKRCIIGQKSSCIIKWYFSVVDSYWWLDSLRNVSNSLLLNYCSKKKKKSQLMMGKYYHHDGDTSTSKCFIDCLWQDSSE